MGIEETIDYLDNINLFKSILCTPEECASHIKSNRKTINIAVQNIRSVSRNLSGFQALLARASIEPDIIVLTECWLQCNKIIPHLDNYIHYHSEQCNNQNDGVITYTKQFINCNTYEPQFFDANCLVTTLNKHNLTLISIYRSPSKRDISIFLQSLRTLLNTIKTKNIIIVGDINIDIKVNSLDPRASNYLDLMSSFGLLPVHTLATRVGNCLDHVFVKTTFPSTALIIENSLTDHNTIFLSIELKNSLSLSGPTYVTKHDFVEIQNEIKNHDFGDILNSKNPNEAALSLVNKVNTIIDKNCKHIRLSRRKTPLKPWLTPGLLRCLRHRDKLHAKVKKYPDNEILNKTYKRYRNHCNKILRQLKNQHIKLELKNANNIKKTWDIINSVTHLKNKKTVPHNLLNISNTPIESVNKVNEHFVTTGQMLADQIAVTAINDSLINFTYYPSYSPPNSFVLLNTDIQEIILIINSLKNTNSVGIDSISAKIIKQNKESLAGLLVYICNLSFETGTFPDIFKKSVITPIFKQGDKNIISNYRPISILPTMSKILEKIINKQLVNYLESHNLLAKNQYGFRKKRSATDAVYDLVDCIVRKLDDGKKCITIFLDLAKAFDTVSTHILLRKLEQMGIRGLPLQLLKSYLSNRYQSVKIGNVISSSLPITHGVPQGSILAPTLFLIYMNQLCNLKMTNGSIMSFADDTALIVWGENWDEVFYKAQKNFDCVCQWLRQNRLSLNANKTKYLTFSITNKTQPSLNTFNIYAHSLSCQNPTCSCPILERVPYIKYLGVQIDKNLNFEQHIKTITNRVRKLIAIFRNVREVADPKLLKTIYLTLCQSLLTYGIDTWGGAAKSHMIPLERAQRLLLKVSHSLPYHYPTVSLYRDCKVLTVRQLFIHRLIMKYHAQTKGKANNSGKRRHYQIFTTKKFNNSFTQNFPCFLGSYLYNKVNKNLNIDKLLNIRDFKIRLFDWLSKLNYEETENLIKILK